MSQIRYSNENIIYNFIHTPPNDECHLGLSSSTAAQQHSSTAAQQHSSTAAQQHSSRVIQFYLWLTATLSIFLFYFYTLAGLQHNYDLQHQHITASNWNSYFRRDSIFVILSFIFRRCPRSLTTTKAPELIPTHLKKTKLQSRTQNVSFKYNKERRKH